MNGLKATGTFSAEIFTWQDRLKKDTFGVSPNDNWGLILKTCGPADPVTAVRISLSCITHCCMRPEMLWGIFSLSNHLFVVSIRNSGRRFTHMFMTTQYITCVMLYYKIFPCATLAEKTSAVCSTAQTEKFIYRRNIFSLPITSWSVCRVYYSASASFVSSCFQNIFSW